MQHYCDSQSPPQREQAHNVELLEIRLTSQCQCRKELTTVTARRLSFFVVFPAVYVVTGAAQCTVQVY